jgi:hypothetical protein
MNKVRIMAASVKKWQRIIDGKGSDGGVLDCPPCRIYYMLICIGCPIAEYTGQKFCKGSPYGEWYRHQIEAHDRIRKRVYCPECKRLAENMRQFMVEIHDHLLAKEEQKKK